MPLIMKKTINGQPVKIRLTDGTLYSNLPIGFILPSFEDITPDGFLKMTTTLANRTVSRTEYKELFDWATARGLIGTGKPFGVGDGSTTFVIPDGKEIAFKGIGEYEGTVGNHVKSGGLANGEFIDDRLGGIGQREVGTGTTNTALTLSVASWSGSTSIPTGEVRTGATTEVKSLGCHYYIKAKNIGVPADFISAMSEYTSYSTEEKFTGKYWIDGKPIYRKVIENLSAGQTDVSSLNIDMVISLTGLTFDANVNYLSFPYCDSAHGFIRNLYYSTTTKNIIYQAEGGSNTKTWAFIEYTKTTD